MPIVPDLGIAAAIALFVFFILLGVLVLLVEDLDLRIVLAGLFILLGVALALAAASEAGVALIVLAAVSALVLDQALEHFATG